MNQNPPNIVLLTVDSLRADHCGFMRSEMDLTHTLDSLAETSIVFENAISPGPRTPSSMPDIFTGEVFGPCPQTDTWSLSARKRRISTHLERHQTIAERLTALGYDTGGVTANPWTQYLPRATFEKGFNKYQEIDGRDLFDDNSDEVPRWLLSANWFLTATGLGERYNWRWKKDWFIQWPHIYDQIAEQVDALSEPYFFWVFILDTHEPYLSPGRFRKENSSLDMYRAVVKDKFTAEDGGDLPESDQTRLRRAYCDATRSVDRFLDRFVEEHGDDSILLFHSDHGEAFGEHGTWGHQPDLYRENLHVPFVISGEVSPDRVTDPVSLREIPTIIEDLSIDAETFDPHEYVDQFAYATTEDGQKRALHGREWTYITDPEGTELYSLVNDPTEQNNVAAEYQEVTRSLSRLERSYLARATERSSITAAVAEFDGI